MLRASHGLVALSLCLSNQALAHVRAALCLVWNDERKAAAARFEQA